MQKGEMPILSAWGVGVRVCQENKVWKNSIQLGIFMNFVQETTYRKNVYPEAAIDFLVSFVFLLLMFLYPL